MNNYALFPQSRKLKNPWEGKGNRDDIKDPPIDAFTHAARQRFLQEQTENGGDTHRHHSAPDAPQSLDKVKEMDIISEQVAAEPKPSKSQKVVLVAYYRGGSTITGQWFQQNRHSAFYLFEPLFSLYRAYLKDHGIPAHFILDREAFDYGDDANYR